MIDTILYSYKGKPLDLNQVRCRIEFSVDENEAVRGRTV